MFDCYFFQQLKPLPPAQQWIWLLPLVVKQVSLSNTDADDNAPTKTFTFTLDEQVNTQLVYPYETRFLQADGTLLIDENDYSTRLANGETVYITCLVGCTNHCG